MLLGNFPSMRSLLLLTISFNSLFLTQPSLAQTSVPPHSEAPLDLSLLEPDASLDGSVITSNTISQQHLTIPSLWWASEQFGGNLLDSWLAYPSDSKHNPRVDLIVNRQNWSLSDYIQRYEFVNHFGSVASDYGYNVRVFNVQQELLATYTCDFSATPRLCNMQVQATGNARVRGSGESLF
ncbi:MAG: hypothetical protein KME05_03775 [Gloeocapsa sp. UFS-A4-WI-NPMV-4B04]|jgi:hypothetical protein|nr:hypothetical protein [Gloeocapsa sp. UFS-A4-WI-NPMV-4B04]